MDKKHTLVGEDFFRTMMRLEDERRRRFVRGDLWASRRRWWWKRRLSSGLTDDGRPRE